MIKTPDPFSPGNYLTIHDPEWLLRQHEGHALCPICSRLRDRLAQQRRFVTDFALVDDPDATQPPEAP